MSSHARLPSVQSDSVRKPSLQTGTIEDHLTEVTMLTEVSQSYLQLPLSFIEVMKSESWLPARSRYNNYYFSSGPVQSGLGFDEGLLRHGTRVPNCWPCMLQNHVPIVLSVYTHALCWMPTTLMANSLVYRFYKPYLSFSTQGSHAV